MEYITHAHFERWLASLDDGQPVTGNITFDADGVWIDNMPDDPGQLERAAA